MPARRKRKRRGVTFDFATRPRQTVSFSQRKRPRQQIMNPRTGGFLGIETKFLDLEFTSTALVTGVAGGEHDPTGNCLNPVAQGDGESQRDGRKYNITSVHLRGRIDFDKQESVTAPESDSIVFIALVHDTQSNGAQMNAEDCYVDPTSTTLCVNTFRNLQFQKRFRVLGTRRITFGPELVNEGAVNLFANRGLSKLWSMNVNFKKPIQVLCNGTTGNVNTITDNSLHLLAWRHSSRPVNIEYFSRLRFIG